MRRYQRGFLFLTTGANGTGKTLFTLKEVHDRSIAEGRPVCYNGRFDMNMAGPLAAWKKIDFKDWQSEPDGTIFLIDECHNDLPMSTRGARELPPPHVSMLAEHRKRGFDFYFITQHPSNMDIFVRRLIGSPGWHRHLKRTFGADLVSQLEWAAVNVQCEKPGSGASGQAKMRPFPKEVYSWYRSAEIHTAKFRLPKQVYVLAVCLLLGGVFAWFGYQKVMAPARGEGRMGVLAAKPGDPSRPAYQPAPRGDAPRTALTAVEYVQARMPRIDGFPHSAPVYDAVTAPTVAPYPAACIHSKNRCECYTQQATKLKVPDSVCAQIASNGFFLEWKSPEPPQALQGGTPGGWGAPSGSGAPAAPATPSSDVALIGDMAKLRARR